MPRERRARGRLRRVDKRRFGRRCAMPMPVAGQRRAQRRRCAGALRLQKASMKARSRSAKPGSGRVRPAIECG